MERGPAQPDRERRQRTARAAHLLLTAVIAAAFIGFFVGIDYGVPHPDAQPPEPAGEISAADVVPAMSYAEVRRRNIGPNRHWRSDLDKLPRPDADVNQEFTPTLAEKLASLEQRSQRRAYNGAPPTIPHSAHQMQSAQCIACHQASVRVGDKTSAALPHPYLTNCQQCHVQSSPQDFEPFVLAENLFEGLPAPQQGARAWPGAPPVIPHATFMRSDCLACHGPTGDPGLRTTHAWRRNCMQCHVPSAELDQGIVAGGVEFLPDPRAAQEQ